MNIKKNQIEGRWVSTMPHDSDDYLVEYFIEKCGNEWSVYAKDLQDDEEMEISNVQWDGQTLKFDSYVPSTGRVGHAIFRLKENGKLESKFTFTVLEELKKNRLNQ